MGLHPQNRTRARETDQGSEARERGYRGRPKTLSLTGSGLLLPEPSILLDFTGAAGRTD